MYHLFFYCLGAINAQTDLRDQLITLWNTTSPWGVNFTQLRALNQRSVGCKFLDGLELPLLEWFNRFKNQDFQAKVVLFETAEKRRLYEELYAEAPDTTYPLWNEHFSFSFQLQSARGVQTFILEFETDSNKNYECCFIREVKSDVGRSLIPLEDAVKRYSAILHRAQPFAKMIYERLSDPAPKSLYKWVADTLSEGIFWLENADLKMTCQEEARKALLPAATAFGIPPSHMKWFQEGLENIDPFWVFQWPEPKMHALLAMLRYEEMDTENSYEPEQYDLMMLEHTYAHQDLLGAFN